MCDTINMVMFCEVTQLANHVAHVFISESFNEFGPIIKI